MTFRGGCAEMLAALIEMAITTHFIDAMLRSGGYADESFRFYEDFIHETFETYDQKFWNDEYVWKQILDAYDGNHKMETDYIDTKCFYHIEKIK